MVVVTRKFQVTIPESVRKDLGIETGDGVVFVKVGSNPCRLLKSTEFTRRVCEDSRDIDKTTEDVRWGLGKGMEGSRNAETGV